MKRLLKKLTALFSSIMLFWTPAASISAMLPGGVSDSILLQVGGVMGREDERILVEVESNLVSGAARYCDHGIEYSELEWISFLSRAVLFHPDFSEFTHIKFCSESPSGGVISTHVFNDDWKLYVIDEGNTAVMTCKSIADIDIDRLREYYVGLIGEIKWPKLRVALELIFRNMPNG